MKKYVLTQTIAADYRVAFFNKLQESLPTLEIWAGDEYFTPSLFSSPLARPAVKQLRNKFLVGKRFLWQMGAYSASVQAKTWVFEMNPRILSSLVILICRKLVGRNCIGWGHAWSKQGKNSWINVCRKSLWPFLDGMIVYSQKERKELADAGFKKPIFTAPNALYSQTEMVEIQRAKAVDPKGIIYVGRIVKEKKVDLLLRAVALLGEKLPSGFHIHIVGDGPLRGEVELLAQHLGIEKIISFYGHNSDVSFLKSIYAQCLASASPGAGGLSLTQSFGYGIPCIVANDEPHGPEFENVTQGFNSLVFEKDSPSSLGEQILRLWENHQIWSAKAPEIAKDCSSKYSIEAMSACFVQAIHYFEK